MTVAVKSRDELDAEYVEGDLVTLVNQLNIAAAQGKQFAVCTSEAGGDVAIYIPNITKMKEQVGIGAITD